MIMIIEKIKLEFGLNWKKGNMLSAEDFVNE